MSLILDALRKADQERQSREHAPGIDAQHEPLESDKPKALIGVVGVIALLLVLMAILLWWLLSPGSSDSSGAATAADDSVAALQASASSSAQALVKKETVTEPRISPSAPPPAVHTTQAPSGTQMVRPEAEARTTGQGEPQFNAHYRAAENDAVTASKTETPLVGTLKAETSKAKTAKVETSQVEASETETSERAPKESASASRVADQASINKLYQQPEVKTADTPKTNQPASPAAVFPGAGPIRELPLSVQNAIPTLMYSLHDYRESGRSSIVLNSQRLYAGQRLGDIEVEAILQDGVVLKREGHVFKLPALSSWVNM